MVGKYFLSCCKVFLVSTRALSHVGAYSFNCEGSLSFCVVLDSIESSMT